MMKIIFYLVTLLLQSLIIYTYQFELVYNPYPFLLVFFGCLLSGLVIILSKFNNKSLVRSLGWGLLYGSVSTCLLVLVFIVLFPTNFTT